jgi:hypothetical protein
MGNGDPEQARSERLARLHIPDIVDESSTSGTLQSLFSCTGLRFSVAPAE